MAILSFGIPLAFLFVPARERFLKDLSGLSGADVLIFDLEDSLKEGEKDEGLKLLLSLDGSKRPENQKWYARLNSDRLEKELSDLKGSCLQGYMLPKFEGTDVLDRFEDLIGEREIAALVETPAGIAALETFSGDKRIRALAFGAEDFCACLNVENNPLATAYARSKLVLYSALNKKISLDMISREFKDREAFKEDLIFSMKTGFKGKLLIHPMQLEVIEEIIADVPGEEIDAIIEAYEKDPSGAVKIDGRLYERMHIERLRQLVKKESI